MSSYILFAVIIVAFAVLIEKKKIDIQKYKKVALLIGAVLFALFQVLARFKIMYVDSLPITTIIAVFFGLKASLVLGGLN